MELSLLINKTQSEVVEEKKMKSYRESGFVITKGTKCMNLPTVAEMREAFKTPYNESGLTNGSRALCKHHGRLKNHPHWQDPRGSPAEINKIAERHLDDVIKNAVWKNMFYLHIDTIILELRLSSGHGMRWRVHVRKTSNEESIDFLEFRGFLEPQEKRASNL